jgi:tyrosine-protein phosphatase SIW14
VRAGAALCIALLAACRHAESRSAQDLPRFEAVSPGIYRGGQPTAAGWAELKRLGIKTVVKLDLTEEGRDDEAERLGLKVIDASGPPSDLHTVFQAPSPERIALAVGSLGDESLRPIFVHCLHGQDRTGIVVGLHRVLNEKKTKTAAYLEMRQRGFHRSLRGLHEMWERFDGKSVPR